MHSRAAGEKRPLHSRACRREPRGVRRRTAIRQRVGNGFPPEIVSLAPKAAGHPGRYPFDRAFWLKQASFVTGASPVTEVYPPVTIAVGAMMVGLTGAVTLVTGKRPVTFPAYLRRLPASYGIDRRDRRFRGCRRKTVRSRHVAILTDARSSRRTPP